MKFEKGIVNCKIVLGQMGRVTTLIFCELS